MNAAGFFDATPPQEEEVLAAPPGMVVQLVAEELYAHRQAENLLGQHPELEEHLLSSLAVPAQLTPKLRRNRGQEWQGVTADGLNTAIKGAFEQRGGWRFEAEVRDGVIWDFDSPNSRIMGFDFARYDRRANLAQLWNLCFGRRALRAGEADWRLYRESNPALHELAEEVAAVGHLGSDQHVRHTEPTVLGEIQFGNWALGYRDMMKILAAEKELDVDLFIYIAAAGELSKALSKGTVSFEKTVGIVKEFANVLRMPIWVVGVDYRVV